MAFNAKNLAYDAKEPAFLQRLKGHYGSTSGGLERPISQRPRRPRDDNEDDGPTYVDAESNEVISKEDYEALVQGDSENQAEKPENGTKDQEAGAEEEGKKTKTEGATSKQTLAEIGGPRKRKQVKVVGEDSQDAEVEGWPKDPRPQKPKQKKKKIKLSFEE
ncbi:hypothetical protein BJY04DRAFT_175568 [Aspergillus karnatakaensis]|uniref:DUF4604 domain-containing protein n=1 Tax=Aspergillus karnatakaensis TaxID=1810916 RepID=UPI003CCCBF73